MVAKARLRGIDSVIPAKFRGVSFDRPPVTQMNEIVVRRVREYCGSIEQNIVSGRGLWLYGSSGTGKTTLAMLVSRTALESGRSVAIYSLPKLLSRIRRTIDDLGAESRTEWVLEQLYALVNERYESQRSLVVTTNLEEQELEDQIGARVVSRLVEMCGDPLPLFDEDRRMRVSADGGGVLGPLDH
jgi:DNA replication protein DnaC